VSDRGAPDAGVPANCPVRFVWDPRTATTQESLPDDFYTIEDARSATGLRPHLEPSVTPWLDSIPESYRPTYRQLEQLDGWGTTAGVVLRFSGPVAPPPEGVLRFVELPGEGPPVVIPFETRAIDDGTTLVLWPMRPLRPGARHAVIVTRALTTPEGGCVAPSDGLLDALAGVTPFERIGPRFVDALAAAGVESAEAVAVVAFTTQTIVEASSRIAADIRSRTYDWSLRPSCVDGPDFRTCRGAFLARDYRGADGRISADGPWGEYELPVRAWLPNGPVEPRPVVVFGHGLGVDKDQGALVAQWLANRGFVTLGIDAPKHGEHPTATPGHRDLATAADFFALDLAARTIDALALRDHFRAATYDKLQVFRLLAAGADLDGDGESDVVPSRMAYVGGSLGGIMGAEFLALTTDVSASILGVPGARVTSILSDGPYFIPILRAMTPPGTPPGLVTRILEVVQTLMERGDGANYARHVLRERLEGTGDAPPHLLMQVALHDRLIPGVSSRALARALGIPHVPPVFESVGLVPVTDAAPVSANLDDGRTTAGLFQFDRGVRPMPGDLVEPADHDVAVTAEGVLQLTHFLETWRETGTPEIIDPYEVLATPPLE
jgi:dienelactone hydrolase